MEAATCSDSGLQKSHFLSSGERTRQTRRLKKDREELEAADFAGNISRESVVDGVKRCPGVSAVKKKKKGCENPGSLSEVKVKSRGGGLRGKRFS